MTATQDRARLRARSGATPPPRPPARWDRRGWALAIGALVVWSLSRAGIDLPLSRFDEISRETAVILNVKPSGHYLMEDVFYAGGVPAVMQEIADQLNGDALTCTGKSIAENIAGAPSIELEFDFTYPGLV